MTGLAGVSIQPLHLHSGYVEPLARGYEAAWPDWYGAGGPGDAGADLLARARKQIPFGLVAISGDRPIGAAAITESSIASHQHLTPWLVGLWVDAAHRRHGVGGLLVSAARCAALSLGANRLFAATATAGSLFVRDGWLVVDHVPADAGGLSVFAANLC